MLWKKSRRLKDVKLFRLKKQKDDTTIKNKINLLEK